MGRVVGRHGLGAVRVRWRKGFPPQGIGTPVEIVVK
jgi:ribosomal protein L35AE/L33A